MKHETFFLKIQATGLSTSTVWCAAVDNLLGIGWADCKLLLYKFRTLLSFLSELPVWIFLFGVDSGLKILIVYIKQTRECVMYFNCQKCCEQQQLEEECLIQSVTPKPFRILYQQLYLSLAGRENRVWRGGSTAKLILQGKKPKGHSKALTLSLLCQNRVSLNLQQYWCICESCACFCMKQFTYYGLFLVLVYSHLADARDTMQVVVGGTTQTICCVILLKKYS